MTEASLITHERPVRAKPVVDDDEPVAEEADVDLTDDEDDIADEPANAQQFVEVAPKTLNAVG